MVVIRYFGGIKLGKKGLIDAYGNAAENVISDSLLIKWVRTENYILTCPMELYGDLSQAFQKFDGSILEVGSAAGGAYSFLSSKKLINSTIEVNYKLIIQ